MTKFSKNIREWIFLLPSNTEFHGFPVGIRLISHFLAQKHAKILDLVRKVEICAEIVLKCCILKKVCWICVQKIAIEKSLRTKNPSDFKKHTNPDREGR